ncbi:MAG: HAD family phosphatase [Acidobacteriota bacterium]|nr:HAD family phosphatase [Acidobacteriota bacterium]
MPIKAPLIKPGALIFDMDGVIVHSNPIHREAWRLYNLRHGIETDEAMQGRMFGKRNDEIVRDFFGADLSEEEVFQHGAAKERLYREMIGTGVDRALVPGIREFLARCQNIPTAVATNAEPENAHFVLRAAGLEHLFRAVVDGCQVHRPKPHPEIYLRAAELLGVAPSACVVFEDSVPGVQSALAAGMTVVGLLTTHAGLPGVALEIADFRGTKLDEWASTWTSTWPKMNGI